MSIVRTWILPFSFFSVLGFGCDGGDLGPTNSDTDMGDMDMAEPSDTVATEVGPTDSTAETAAETTAVETMDQDMTGMDMAIDGTTTDTSMPGMDM